MKASLGKFEIRPGVYMDSDGNLYHLEIWDSYNHYHAKRYYHLSISPYRYTTAEEVNTMKGVLKFLGCKYIGKL